MIPEGVKEYLGKEKFEIEAVCEQLGRPYIPTQIPPNF